MIGNDGRQRLGISATMSNHESMDSRQNNNYIDIRQIRLGRLWFSCSTKQVSNEDNDLALGEQGFSSQWARIWFSTSNGLAAGLQIMNSAAVRLQQADKVRLSTSSSLNDLRKSHYLKRKRRESVIHFVVAISIFLLSSPKYASTVLDVWRQPGIYHFFW